MRVGVDAQVVANGNRSGLYNCLRFTVRELRPLLNDRLWLLADAPVTPVGKDAPGLSEAMDGAKVRVVRPSSRLGRALQPFSIVNRLDVLWHNLHGVLPPDRRAANAYLVPDVIPLAVDYGVPGFTDAYRPFYEAAAMHGDVVLVFSEHAKRDFLTRIGGSPELVHVAPLAAADDFRPVEDRERLRPALGPHGLADTPYVLMVSTLEVRKNHAVLLRAFARLIERDRSLRHRLVLVGEPWIGHEAVFEMIRQLGLQDRLTYVGFAEQLPAFYAGADAFVFPSLYEGFGLPPLEAMASGVPVLAAHTTSLPEVVGDAGVLFDPYDVDGLADALLEVLTDRTLHDGLRRRGLDHAATFSWRRTAQLYMEAFQAGVDRARERAAAGSRPPVSAVPA